MKDIIQNEHREIFGELEKFTAHIDSLYRKNEIQGLIEIAEEANSRYYRQMVTIALRLGLKNLRENAQQDPLNEHLNSSFGEFAYVPLRVEMSIVDFLRNDAAIAKNLNAKNWSKYRTIAAKLVFNAWYRLKRSLDEDFDIHTKPVLNVSPPIETGLPSGVAPEAITDPVLRAKYEQAIADNASQLAYNRQQQTLHQMDKQFSRIAEEYLIDIYAKPPVAVDELERYANPEILGKDTVERLLALVRKNRESIVSEKS